MPRKPDRAERGGILGLLFGDFWRKLFALALATGLWLYLDSQVSLPGSLEVELTPVSLDTDPSAARSQEMSLRLDLARYSVLGFQDADAPSTSVERVTITVRGPRRLVTELLEAPRFSVPVEPIERDGQPVFEFALADVRASEARYEGLLRSMTPSRVRIELARNTSASIALQRSRIRVIAPPNEPGLAERIVWDDLKVTPSVVTIRGPENTVRAIQTSERALFEFRPNATTPDQRSVSAPLQLAAEFSQVTVSPDTVAMDVPLRTAGRVTKLNAVPIVLAGEHASRFELAETTLDLEILAYGQLETELALHLVDDQLRTWIAANCLVIAFPPADGGQPRAALHIAGHTDDEHRVSFWPSIKYRSKT
jgi:hypothetical protein